MCKRFLNFAAVMTALSLSPAWGQSPTNEGPDAGHAIGDELVEVANAREDQLEPITDIRRVPGYLQVVEPLLAQLRVLSPRFYYDLSAALRDKSWFYVSGPMNLGSKYKLDKRDFKRVGKQNDAIIKLYKPWMMSNKVQFPSKGGLIVHELVVSYARTKWNKVEEGHPDVNDVEELVEILLAEGYVPHMTLTQLNALLRQYKFIGYPYYNGDYEGPGAQLKDVIRSSMQEGFGFKDISIGVNTPWMNSGSGSPNQYFEVTAPTKDGKPLRNYRGYGEADIHRFCSRFFSPDESGRTGNCSGSCSSSPYYWELGPVIKPITKDAKEYQEVLWVRCARSAPWVLDYDLDQNGHVIYQQ